MRRYHETFRLWEYLLFALVTLAVLCLCVCVGSVRIPLADTLAYFAARLTGGQQPAGLVHSGLFRVEMFKILHFFKTPVPLNSCYTGAPRQLAGLTVIFTMLRLTAAVSMSSR